MELDKLVPRGWAEIIRQGGHGNLLDQNELAKQPRYADYNRRLVDDQHSVEGAEVAFLFDNSSMYRCFRLYQRIKKKVIDPSTLKSRTNPNDVFAMNVPDECDPPIAAMKGLERRPLRYEDFFEWNVRYESDQAVEDHARRVRDAKEKAKAKRWEEGMDKVVGEAEDALIDKEANPGKYAPQTATGWTKAEEEGAAEPEPEPEPEPDGREREIKTPAPEPEPAGQAPEERAAEFKAAFDASGMTKAAFAKSVGERPQTAGRWMNRMPATEKARAALNAARELAKAPSGA